MQPDRLEQEEAMIRPIKDESRSWDVDDDTVNHFDIQRQQSSEDETLTWQPNKRTRTSKRDIPDYSWSDEGEERLANFIKENPELYDKKQKDWLNVAAKTSLWIKIGELLDPPASYPQCKKHYENMRTRVGKIMKRERTKGTGHSVRSIRDGRIMDTWSFLIQHIGRMKTGPGEQFSTLKSSTYSTSSDNDEEDEEEVPPARHQARTCTTTGKGKRKKKPPVAPTTQTATATTATSEITHIDHREAIRQIISHPDFMCARFSYTGHQSIVHNFACLLEGHMQGIPEESWHDFQIDCLNLVHRYKHLKPGACYKSSSKSTHRSNNS